MYSELLPNCSTRQLNSKNITKNHHQGVGRIIKSYTFALPFEKGHILPM